jgi:N-acetylneuraminate lyase
LKPMEACARLSADSAESDRFLVGKSLVLGLGNTLISDDGFGPGVVEECRRRGFEGTNGAEVVEFLEAAADRIPNLAGAKFTYENLMDFIQCVRLAGGRYDVLFGRDEILLAGLAMGARGAVGSTYNFAAPVYHRLIAAFQQGDLATAQAEQARAVAMIDVFVRFGGLSAGKAIMKLIGLDCGSPRLPLRTLTDTQESQLRQSLEQVGFFQFCSRVC